MNTPRGLAQVEAGMLHFRRACTRTVPTELASVERRIMHCPRFHRKNFLAKRLHTGLQSLLPGPAARTGPYCVGGER